MMDNSSVLEIKGLSTLQDCKSYGIFEAAVDRNQPVTKVIFALTLCVWFLNITSTPEGSN